MTNLEILIKTCVELGSAQTMEALGVSSGEISLNKAISIYGRYIKEAVRDGKITPCRVGKGRNGTKYFRVVDILSLKAKEAIKAELR